jgi:hypothetical protein
MCPSLFKCLPTFTSSQPVTTAIPAPSAMGRQFMETEMQDCRSFSMENMKYASSLASSFLKNCNFPRTAAGAQYPQEKNDEHPCEGSLDESTWPVRIKQGTCRRIHVRWSESFRLKRTLQPNHCRQCDGALIQIRLHIQAVAGRKYREF